MTQGIKQQQLQVLKITFSSFCLFIFKFSIDSTNIRNCKMFASLNLALIHFGYYCELKNQMSLKFLRPIEKITVRIMGFVNLRANLFGDTHHLRVEISHPIHLKFLIRNVLPLNQLCRLHNQRNFKPPTLMFRYNTENNTKHGFATVRQFSPQKQQLSPGGD